MDRPDKVALIFHRPLARLLCLTLLAVVVSACSGRRHTPSTEPPGAEMGIYRATLDAPSGKTRKFRLLLYARLPDRIHGEILSPVGTTEAIFDGGDGRVAVTLPRDRVSYVGDGNATAMAKVLGVRLSLEELVSSLLGAEQRSGAYVVERSPAGQSGLPEWITITGSGYRLALQLRKKQPLRVSTATLGNGEPPPSMERRPLESLEGLTFPDDAETGGER